MDPGVTGSVPERLYVRVDATAATGLGHFMRCIALAQAWQDRGGRVSFIGRYGPASRERLQREGIECIAIDERANASDDLAATRAAIAPGSPVVLDGYTFDPAYQRGLSECGRLLMIDDMGQWPAYAGTLLLNQNPHAAAVRYVAAPEQRLLGPDYVLLTREFAAAAAVDCSAPVALRWLVTLGGSDPDNAGPAIVEALVRAAPTAQIAMVVGPLNTAHDLLEALARQHANLELIYAPPSMVATLGRADLAVSAGGTTSLQLARLGVPTLLLAIADNQEPLGRALATAGASVYLGRWPEVTPGEIAVAALGLAHDAARRVALGQGGRRLIDGRGAGRVAAALAAASPR